MDVFNYLENDNASIAERLTETAKNYSEWAQERVFEEAKKAFASAKQHFSSASLLESNLKNNEPVKELLSEINRQKKEIMDEIDQIVEIHVDEPGFEQSLETIANKFSQYFQYCKNTYYPAMQKALTADDLKHVSDQLEQKVLS
jgi:vacuolar-type H+-ATPase subunit E/Vma4